MNELITTLTIWALPVLLAITLHEAAHGYVAHRFGDHTAYRLGRVSLNPLHHIDPVGTVLLPAGLVLLAALTGSSTILFGWAKPVPVVFNNLRHPKADMLWVAGAGPAANLLMAIGWALLFKLAIVTPENAYTVPLMRMADAGMQINTTLMVLNLLPLPPLDGGRMLVSLLPLRAARKLAALEPWGFPILLLLVFTDVLSYILWPLIALVRVLLATLFGF